MAELTERMDRSQPANQPGSLVVTGSSLECPARPGARSSRGGETVPRRSIPRAAISRVTPCDAASLKPLFIALKREYFEAFRDGTKRREYRLLGQGWNKHTCLPGRRVVLSLGYGKVERLQGRIVSFKTAWAPNLPYEDMTAIGLCYGTKRVTVAVIDIKLEEKR